MDELSLLEADSIEAVQAAERRIAGEAAKYRVRAPDFTGTLDYIDSLASRRALALSRRDVANITTAAMFTPSLPLGVSKAVPVETDVSFGSSTDFRPLGDARRFDPEGSFRPPRALVRSAARLVSPPIVPGWRPKDPTLPPNRWREDWDREAEVLKRISRIKPSPFARRFSYGDQVVICLKRKIRRQMMHAMGFAGYPPSMFRTPRRTYYSKVVC